MSEKPINDEIRIRLCLDAGKSLWKHGTVERLLNALDAERERADEAECGQTEAANIAAKDAFERGVRAGVRAGIRAAAGAGLASSRGYAVGLSQDAIEAIREIDVEEVARKVKP